MRYRATMLLVAFLLAATAANAVPRYAVLTFYDWRGTKAQIDKYQISAEFVQMWATPNIANALNAGAREGWEPVQVVFVPGSSGADDPRRASDKFVIIVRNLR